MRKLVYIASPLGGRLENVRKATEVWLNLTREGVLAICPHWSVFANLMTPLPYGAWMAYDFQILEHCQALFRTAGYSPGADQEEFKAGELGIPVFRDLGELLEWYHS